MGPSLLIATDSCKHYGSVVQRTFGIKCVYGQAMKTWRKNRITMFETKVVTGDEWSSKTRWWTRRIQ